MKPSALLQTPCPVSRILTESLNLGFHKNPVAIHVHGVKELISIAAVSSCFQEVPELGPVDDTVLIFVVFTLELRQLNLICWMAGPSLCSVAGIRNDGCRRDPCLIVWPFDPPGLVVVLRIWDPLGSFIRARPCHLTYLDVQ